MKMADINLILQQNHMKVYLYNSLHLQSETLIFGKLSFIIIILWSWFPLLANNLHGKIFHV